MTKIEKILFEMTNIGPMLPGSIRRTYRKNVCADGRITRFETMPIYTWTNLDGKQTCKRVPKKQFEEYEKLINNYTKLKVLFRELDEALRLEYLPKNGSRCKKKS